MNDNLIFIIFISMLKYAFSQYITKGITQKIDKVDHPIIFNANERCLNIISPESIYVVNKEDNSIKFQKEIQSYNAPFLLYKDKSNNYFLLAELSRYKILLNDENEIYDLVNDDFILDHNLYYYFGYILLKGSRKNEIIDSIIYGLNNNGIYFYSTSRDQIYSFEHSYVGNIENNSLSCEQIEYNYFICILGSVNNLQIKTIKCDYDVNDKCKEIVSYDGELTNYYDGFIYNTLHNNIKVFCFKMGVINKIDCSTLIIIDNSQIIKGDNFNLPSGYSPDSCEVKNCKFIDVLNEYLFCCACNDYIICTRLTLDFEIINTFYLSCEGENSFLGIINNINYFSILFLNGKSIYKKDIYPPNCNDITKEIYQEVEINIKELFDRKKDDNYFIIFEDFNSEVLAIKSNEESIQSGIKIFLDFDSNPDEISFKFILNKDNLRGNNNLNIKYTIENEEKYSSTCSMNLIVNSNSDNKLKIDNYFRKLNEYSSEVNSEFDIEQELSSDSDFELPDTNFEYKKNNNDENNINTNSEYKANTEFEYKTNIESEYNKNIENIDSEYNTNSESEYNTNTINVILELPSK